MDVVYPRLEGGAKEVILPRLDSTFAFGSVQPPQSRVIVNGQPARVWPNGAFLSFGALDTTQRLFIIVATSATGDSQKKTIPFRFMAEGASDKEKPLPHPLNQHLPCRITISQDHAALRATRDGAYVLLPPRGCVAWADSFAQSSFRVRLTPNLHAWIDDRYVLADTADHSPVQSVITRVIVRGGDPWLTIEIQGSERTLFALSESAEKGSLILDLYGSRSRINRIDYGSGDFFLNEIRWAQPDDEALRLEFFLGASCRWGYGAAWSLDDPAASGGAKLFLKIRRPPAIEKKVLRNRIIALDPGHGGDQPGAIGPTRLLEKEPNLKLALKLREILAREGARVILTRSADSTVDLYERVDYAVREGAEILLSLHNNALSDGENPFIKHGSAVYYYHPQSLDLARTLHEHLLAATQLPDYGLYYQNLALARPTEMLAVLLECAFMLYPDEESLLRDDAFLAKIAAGIASGLKEYLAAARAARPQNN